VNQQQHIVASVDELTGEGLLAAGVTVREREELSALMPSVLDKAFRGEL